MINFGLIGCGAWGWRYIPAALESTVARVSHVHRPGTHVDSETLSDVKIVPKWESLINESIDAVIIATPPSSHAEIAEYFLSRGKPIIVEKPMTLSSLEAEYINPGNIPFLVNHIQLFSPAYEELRYLYLNSYNTESTYIYSWNGNKGPFRDYSVIWDYAPHDISMCLGLANGKYPDVIEKYNILGRKEIILTFDDLFIKCNIQVWNNQEPKTRIFELFSENTHLVYNDYDIDKLKLNNSPIIINNVKPLTNVIKTFVEAINTGKTDWRFGVEIGKNVVKIIEKLESDI